MQDNHYKRGVPSKTVNPILKAKKSSRVIKRKFHASISLLLYRVFISNFATVLNCDLLAGLSGSGSKWFHFLNNIHAFNHFPKDRVFPIEPIGFCGADEKLRSTEKRFSYYYKTHQLSACAFLSENIAWVAFQFAWFCGSRNWKKSHTHNVFKLWKGPIVFEIKWNKWKRCLYDRINVAFHWPFPKRPQSCTFLRCYFHSSLFDHY